MIGSVDSGQSIVRATTTATPFVFHKMRVQALTVWWSDDARNKRPSMPVSGLRKRMPVARLWEECAGTILHAKPKIKTAIWRRALRFFAM
jgi:hypothetical protein